MKRSLLFSALLLAGFSTQAQEVTTWVGTGEAGFSGSSSSAAAARFDMPYAAVTDSKGNTWITDENSHYIVLITGDKYYLRSGDYQGGFTEGTGAGAGKFNFPKGMVVGAGDTLFIVDNGNSAIRRLDPIRNITLPQKLTTIAGGGFHNQNGENGFVNAKGMAARFNYPAGIAISPDQTYLLVADKGNEVIRKVMLTGEDYGVVSTYAGIAGTSGSLDGPAIAATFNGPEGIYMHSNGDVYVSETYGTVRKISGGMVSSVVSGTELESPASVVVNGDDMYIADGCHIKHYDMTSKALKVFAGKNNGEEADCEFADGTGEAATFNNIGHMSLSSDAKYMLVADRLNNRIRKVTVAEGTVGISKTVKADIKIYPNPAENFIMVEGITAEKAIISLYDITGRKVSENLLIKTGNNFKVDIASQNAGIYLMQITTPGNIYNQRILIK